MSSFFYQRANEAMSNECQRLCDFTDGLDKAPDEKRTHIVEYKCAKFRYAAISNIQVPLLHSNRLKDRLKESYYLWGPAKESAMKNDEFLRIFEAASEAQKPDVGLYYGMIALVDDMIAERQEKLRHANDWESVELRARLEGYFFAKACLDEAWKRREEAL